jgi:hypothetical protein
MNNRAENQPLFWSPPMGLRKIQEPLPAEARDAGGCVARSEDSLRRGPGIGSR